MEEMNMSSSKCFEIRRLRCEVRSIPDEAHPSHSDRVVILAGRAVMLRESSNSRHHPRDRFFVRKTAGIDPGQANVLAMVEHLVGNPERFKCLSEVLIGPGFGNDRS